MTLHGLLHCRRCWADEGVETQEQGPFRLVRDPGHWGAVDPQILVLGLSKGNTQSGAVGFECFESIAFKGMRDRLLNILQSVGLLPEESIAKFDQRFLQKEQDYAFASMVRCSLTAMHAKKGIHTADSPNVVPAFRSGSAGFEYVKNCATQFLLPLTQRTKLVLLLGNSDPYISAILDLIDQVRGGIRAVSPIAFDSDSVRFVHLAHPSRANGHFGKFIRGEGTPGKKRDLAAAAIHSLLWAEN